MGTRSPAFNVIPGLGTSVFGIGKAADFFVSDGGHSDNDVVSERFEKSSKNLSAAAQKGPTPYVARRETRVTSRARDVANPIVVCGQAPFGRELPTALAIQAFAIGGVLDAIPERVLLRWE